MGYFEQKISRCLFQLQNLANYLKNLQPSENNFKGFYDGKFYFEQIVKKRRVKDDEQILKDLEKTQFWSQFQSCCTVLSSHSTMIYSCQGSARSPNPLSIWGHRIPKVQVSLSVWGRPIQKLRYFPSVLTLHRSGH